MIKAEGLGEPFIFVTFAARSGRRVDLVVEGEVRAVEFPRGDADDGTIFSMELDDLEGVLAVEYDIVIQLVPKDG